MLITPALAATGALMAQVGPIAPLVLIFVVFYFLLIRPQQKQRKELHEMRKSLKRGDRIVTGGGIIGTVHRSREGEAEIEVDIAANVRVLMLRDSVSALLKAHVSGETKQTNEAR